MANLSTITFRIPNTELINIGQDKRGKLFMLRWHKEWTVRIRPSSKGTVFYAETTTDAETAHILKHLAAEAGITTYITE